MYVGAQCCHHRRATETDDRTAIDQPEANGELDSVEKSTGASAHPDIIHRTLRVY